jgi:hypothetical protein
MQFLRKIIQSDDIEKGIKLPRSMKHKKVELLIFPVGNEENEDDADWSSFSLSQAMLGMENETTPEYTAQDIKDMS